MHATTLKKEAMNLKKRKEGYVGGLGVSKETGEM